MTGHRIRPPKGFRVDKHGRLVRSDSHLDVSALELRAFFTSSFCVIPGG
jgi:hypothetical protein